MMHRVQLSLFLTLFVLIYGCSPIISRDLRAKFDSPITFKEVQQDPIAYKGDFVLWGGEIIQTLQEKGRTFIEVLEWPLGWRGKPKRTVAFQGRFLILLKEDLDSSLYQEGEKVIVAGEIEGSMHGDRIEKLSDPAYSYPLILSKQIHVWKGNSYPYSSSSYPSGSYEYNPYNPFGWRRRF